PRGLEWDRSMVELAGPLASRGRAAGGAIESGPDGQRTAARRARPGDAGERDGSAGSAPEALGPAAAGSGGLGTPGPRSAVGEAPRKVLGMAPSSRGMSPFRPAGTSPFDLQFREVAE